MLDDENNDLLKQLYKMRRLSVWSLILITTVSAISNLAISVTFLVSFYFTHKISSIVFTIIFLLVSFWFVRARSYAIKEKIKFYTDENKNP